MERGLQRTLKGWGVCGPGRPRLLVNKEGRIKREGGARARLVLCARRRCDALLLCMPCWRHGWESGDVGMWGCEDVCACVCEEDGSEGRGAAEQRQQRRHQEYGEGLCAEARGQKRETQSRAECTKQRGAWGRRGGGQIRSVVTGQSGHLWP